MNRGVREKVAGVFSDLGDYLNERGNRNIRERGSGMFYSQCEEIDWFDRLARTARPDLIPQICEQIARCKEEYVKQRNSPLRRRTFTEDLCFVGAEICYRFSYSIGKG